MIADGGWSSPRVSSDPAFMLTDSIMIRLVRLRGFMFTDLVRISSAPDSRPQSAHHYMLGSVIHTTRYSGF